jgi:hypothetical protein
LSGSSPTAPQRHYTTSTSPAYVVSDTPARRLPTRTPTGTAPNRKQWNCFHHTHGPLTMRVSRLLRLRRDGRQHGLPLILSRSTPPPESPGWTTRRPESSPNTREEAVLPAAAGILHQPDELPHLESPPPGSTSTLLIGGRLQAGAATRLQGGDHGHTRPS